jgi:hypothetical protein
MPTDNFQCTHIPGLAIPQDKQPGFCARQHRLGKAICGGCTTGITAAKTEAEIVRSGLSPVKLLGHQRGNNKESNHKEKKAMGTAMKKCVDCGEEYKATSNVQKRCASCKAKKKASGGGGVQGSRRK